LGVGSGNLTTGPNNVGIGSFTLSNNTTGYRNTALGRAALYNSNGLQNSAIGFNALYSNTSGSGNTAIGDVALQFNTTGNGNTALGQAALFANTTGYSNVAIGIDALSANTGNSNLVAIGDSALKNNTTGTINVAIGSKSLMNNLDGFENTATGYRSLLTNTNGAYNAAFGGQALQNNTVGYSNTAIGTLSMFSNTTGIENTAVGKNSLFSNSTGVWNTALGEFSLYYTVAGKNTGVGVGTLVNNTSGTGNIGLGFQADVLSNNLTNATAIGSNAAVGASNSLVLGSINGINNAIADVNVGIGITTPTGRLHIKHNSFPVPTLLLEESENDFTRMRFINTNANSFWEMNALPQTSNTTARIEFWNSSSSTVTTPFILYGNGNATLSGTLTQNSDLRLKKNIQPIHNALDAIRSLNGYTYNWKDNFRDASLQVGVIAQEVQKVFPSLVKEDDKGVLSVNYSGLIPVLIEALKEQQKQIDELKQMLHK
jgi:hypothetical protein